MVCVLPLVGQQLEEVDKFGSTALWLACSAGRVEAVKVGFVHAHSHLCILLAYCCERLMLSCDGCTCAPYRCC